MLVTVLGIHALMSPVQFANAEAPIVPMLTGSLTAVSLTAFCSSVSVGSVS